MPHIKVVCSCGYAIGSLYKAFRALKQDLNERQLAKDGDCLPSNTIITGQMPELGPILDALGIMNECCRNQMITMVSALQYLPE